MIGPRQAAVLRAMPMLGMPAVAAIAIAGNLPATQRAGLYVTLKRLESRGLVVSSVVRGSRLWQIKAIGVGELRAFDELVGARVAAETRVGPGGEVERGALPEPTVEYEEDGDGG